MKDAELDSISGAIAGVLTRSLAEVQSKETAVSSIAGGTLDGSNWSDAYKQGTDILVYFADTLDRFNPGKTDSGAKALKKALPLLG